MDDAVSAESEDQDVSAGSGAHSDVAALRMTIQESRRTFDKQIALVNEIDDKAMRTVRTAFVVVGFIISALGIGGTRAVAAIGTIPLLFASAGVLALSVTIVVGIGIYTVTDVPLGIGDSFRQEVTEGEYSEREWSSVLLAGYSEWSEDVREHNERNTDLLNRIQLLLICGLLLLVLAAFILVAQVILGG